MPSGLVIQVDDSYFVRVKVDRQKTPLCIRFRPKDLQELRLAAFRRQEALTVCIREWVLNRVVAMEEGLDVSRLTFSDASEKGRGRTELLAVRFSPKDYARIEKQAVRENQAPSPWVRAIALEYAHGP